MRFMTYVFGDNPEQQLEAELGSEFDFIVGKEVRKLCEDAGIPFSAEKILDTIREHTKSTGTVAIVDSKKIAILCPKLYLAGVEYFITMDDGTPRVINRLVIDKNKLQDNPMGRFVGEVKDELDDLIESKELNLVLESSDIMRSTFADYGQKTIIDDFTIGGRWHNWLIAKPGRVGEKEDNVIRLHEKSRFDRLRLKDIDWDQMWKEHLIKTGLEDEWAQIEKVMNGRTFESQHQVNDRLGVPKIPSKETYPLYEQARNTFIGQPVVGELLTAGYNFPEVNFIARGKEKFQAFKGLGSFLPLAYLSNGVWKQRAHREFMGIMEEEIYPDDFKKMIDEVIKSLPEDTWLTVVDCHC